MTQVFRPVLSPSGSLTEIDLCGWIGQANPRDALEYHRGFLALDTLPFGPRLNEKARVDLQRVANRAFWAAEQGLVHLVQRRIAPDVFSYIAIARPRPRRASVSLSTLLLEEAA